MEKANQFNNLERAVLDWFTKHYQEPTLAAQIHLALFKERRWTKVGFYVDIEVPKNLEPIDFAQLDRKSFPIKGPDINSSEIEFDGGTFLWGKNGYLERIEMYANGSFFRETVENFRLIP